MQQIERVGAVALLFILVTVVAVTMWDEGEPGDVQAASAEGDSAQPGQKPAGQKAERNRKAPEKAPEQKPTTKKERHQAAPKPGEIGATRAKQRGQQNNLLGSAQAAAVPSGNVDPALTEVERPVNQERKNEKPADIGPAVQERGWDNGRKSTEEIARQKASRKRPAQNQGGGAAKVAGGGGLSHTVQKHETLGEIASDRLGSYTRWKEIAQLNGIQGTNIRAGQVLMLPSGAKPAAQAPAATPSVTPLPKARVASNNSSQKPSGRTYTIRKGDVLSVISQRELGTSKRWREILDLNPGLDPNKLFVGKSILLPTRSATPAQDRELVAANVPTRSSKRRVQ